MSMSFALFADIAVKATILLAFLFVVSTALRRAPAALRHLVWATGLAALLALPILSLTLPWRLEILPFGPAVESSEVLAPVDGFAPQSSDGTATEGRDEKRPDAAGATEPAAARPLLQRASAEESLPATLPAASERQTTASPFAWLSDRLGLLAVVWLAGLAAVAGRLLVGMAAIRKIARRGVHLEGGLWKRLRDRAALRLGLNKPVRLLMSPRAPIPFGAGWLRPLVVVPSSAASWSEERRLAVLLHELAHLRRRDYLAHLVAQVACAVFWFHPLVWLAARRLRAESERACDDLVLRCGTRASHYANHLIEIVRSSGRSWALAAAQPMARRSEFEGRLLAILEPNLKRHAPGRVTATAMVLTVTLAAVPLAAMAPDKASASSASRPPTHGGLETITLAAPGDLAVGDIEAKEAQQALKEPESGAGEELSVALKEIDEAGSAETVAGHLQPTEKPAEPEARVEPAQSQTPEVDRVAALLGVLDDNDPEVRQTVVRALGDLQDTSAVTALARSLREDSDAEVREASAWALGEIEDARAIPALGEALRQDEVPAVRRMAAWALGEIEDPRAIDVLGAGVTDRDAEVRQQSIRALGEIESPAAIDVLAPALEDDDPKTRELAVWALGEIEDARAVPALSQVLRTDADAAIRLAAARALGEIESRNAVEALSAALADGDARVRAMAVWALGEIEDPSALDALVGVLADSEPELRLQAVRALGEIEDRRAVEPLVAVLDDENAKVREAAAWALGEIEDPSAAPGLTAALADTDVAVRRRAARALGEIELRSAPQALIDALDDQDPQVRLLVARALGEIEDPAAVPGLAALLNDADIQVRRMAVRALGEIESPEAYRVLVQALDDEDPEIRKYAARALGKRND